MAAMSGDWMVLHQGHTAWFQRAFMLGDFAPGGYCTSWYAVDEEGRSFDPYQAPKCLTCGCVPLTNDTVVVEVATGQKDFLARLRERGRWPRPTDAGTCWWCNVPGLELATGLLCRTCEAHLRTR